MGQQANTWPALTRSTSRAGRPRLLFSTSIITQVSRRNVAMSTAGQFFEACVVLLAQLLDPFRGSLLEFGMVLVFPGTGGGFQGFDLAQTHQFLFRRLGQKSAAPALADQGVDLDSQLVGNDDMGTLDVHRPTDSLTGYGISRLASAIVGETERVPWGKPWDRQPVSGKLRRKLGVSPGFAAYPPERLATPTSPTAAPTHPPPADFARNPSADPVAARSGRRRAPSPGNRGPLRTPRRCPPPPPPAPAAR